MADPRRALDGQARPLSRRQAPRMMPVVQPVAFVFGGYPPPLRRGHLPLADLTVLLGPNDAGKSRTLGALAAMLDGGSPARGAAVIAECGPEERALLGARVGSSGLADDGAPLVIVEPA